MIVNQNVTMTRTVYCNCLDNNNNNNSVSSQGNTKPRIEATNIFIAGHTVALSGAWVRIPLKALFWCFVEHKSVEYGVYAQYHYFNAYLKAFKSVSIDR